MRNSGRSWSHQPLTVPRRTSASISKGGSPSFSHKRGGGGGSDGGGSPASLANGPSGATGTQSFSPPLRRTASRAIYLLILVYVALHASVWFEEMARQMSHSNSSPLPKRAQVLIGLLGTGQLGRPLFSGPSSRERMRLQYEAGREEREHTEELSPLHGLPLPATLRMAVEAAYVRLRPRKKPKCLIRALPVEDTSVSMLQQQQLIASGSLADAPLREWKAEEVVEVVPVVFITNHVPNEPRHPALTVIKQARKLNRHVYVVGPNPNLKHLSSLDVTIEGRDVYKHTFKLIAKEIGSDRLDVGRLWFLHAFMQRHNFSRALLLSTDVMLYANASQMAAWLFPHAHAVLPVRWPSMQPPPLPSQYVSTVISNHVALWHVDALEDFLHMFRTILHTDLFGGRRHADPSLLVRKKEYGEMVMLGWYAWSECWTNDRLQPKCMAEPIIGISPKITYRMRRTKFRPKYLVESFCQPRMCQNSTWSGPGLCVFDNNFSVSSPSKFFKFVPSNGDKCPQSKMYEFYHAWMGQTPRRSVQFLGVNFQGIRRNYLKMEDPDPGKTWGSAVF